MVQPATSPPTSPAPFTVDWIVRQVTLLLTDQAYFHYFAALLLLGEAVLSFLIINFIPYTEIDFSTYMQQVELFMDGERDYSLIKGDSGPIVYPAGFVYFYSAVHYLTEGGDDLQLAQYYFAAVYLVTLAMVFVLFRRCRSLPPYALIPICLSKRLHSIYLLRLSNDPIAVFFLYAAVLAWTTNTKRWTIGTILFSIALSIKMNILLYLPALLFLYYTTLGPIGLLSQLSTLVGVQLLLATPFLSTSQFASNYFHIAFDFSREFMWEWTVNWRWLGQVAFENKSVHRALLVGHVVVLIVCGFKWCERDGGVYKVVMNGLRRPRRGATLGDPTPDHICTVLFTSNLVGVIFARSLHYQFYSWYAHQLVFLAWHTPFDLLQRIGLLAAIELGWNTFPSTERSSLALTSANVLILVGVLYGFPRGIQAKLPGVPKNWAEPPLEGVKDKAE